MMLPPGRARLATKPDPTGSPVPITTGMVVVARFTASATIVPTATMISGLPATVSDTNSPSRSTLPLRQADQARTDFALIEGQLEVIANQLAEQPTRRARHRRAGGCAR